MQSHKSRIPSHAERLYREVKSAAVAYRFPPGARINEVGLAKTLGASRTPLREALNRLVAEGFLTFERDRGFFCRELSPRQIFELYQFRAVLQTAAVRLACEHATETELDELEGMLATFGAAEDARSVDEWIDLDERFHLGLTALSRNEEMLRVLGNINDRIRFVRMLDMESRYGRIRSRYQALLDALRRRDPDLAAARMAGNIERRLDEITRAVNRGREILETPREALT